MNRTSERAWSREQMQFVWVIGSASPRRSSWLLLDRWIQSPTDKPFLRRRRAMGKSDSVVIRILPTGGILLDRYLALVH